MILKDVLQEKGKPLQRDDKKIRRNEEQRRWEIYG